MATNVTTKSINSIIKKLKKIEASTNEDINYWFFAYSLNWIKNRANTLLNQRTNGYNSSVVREMWELKIDDTFAFLVNNYEESAAIEFGVGVKGFNEKNPKAQNDPRIIAAENNYIYDKQSKHKNAYGGWAFELLDGTVIYTYGYGGKSFLYDSLMEYINRKKYIEFYEKAYNKTMKRIVK